MKKQYLLLLVPMLAWSAPVFGCTTCAHGTGASKAKTNKGVVIKGTTDKAKTNKIKGKTKKAKVIQVKRNR